MALITRTGVPGAAALLQPATYRLLASTGPPPVSRDIEVISAAVKARFRSTTEE